MRRVAFDGSFAQWRPLARQLVCAGVAPADVTWSATSSEQRSLFEAAPVERAALLPRPEAQPLVVPAEYLRLAATVAHFRSDEKWDLLYRLLYRIHYEQRELLQNPADPDVHRAETMARQIRRDIHKMHAFVRFRRVDHDDGEAFVAWYKPLHLIVPLAAPFFVRRFGAMTFALLTPDASAFWDQKRLVLRDGVPASAAPPVDAAEDLWKTYYASIFNPARVNPRAMKREMPVRHWATLPEAELIPSLLRDAKARTEVMLASEPQIGRRRRPSPKPQP